MIRFYDISNELPASPQSTVVEVNAETKTYEFVIQPRARGEVSASLTIEDLRELRKTGLNNTAYFEAAKRVFAAGGGAKQIRQTCGLSPSAAKKVLAALNRAKMVQVQNTAYKIK